MEEKEKYMTPLKAIRLKCLDCVCFQINEVRLCPSTDCPLHPYRFGKNPFTKGKKRTEEQKKVASERLKNYHNQKKKETKNEQED